MASSGKKKTTMAKLSRESKLRERRVEKKARKDARRLAAANPPTEGSDMPNGEHEPESITESDRLEPSPG